MNGRSLLLIAALGCAFPALAQESRPTEPAPSEPAKPAEPAPKPAKPAANPKDPYAPANLRKLGMSEAEIQQVRQVLRDNRLAMRAALAKLREEGKTGKAARKEAQKAARKELGAKLKELLGKERFRQLRELQAKMSRKKGDQRGQQRGNKNKNKNKNNAKGQPSVAQVLGSLSLSEEEQAVIAPRLEGLLETRKLLQGEQGKRLAAFRASLADADPTKVEQALAEFRQARDEDEATIQKAQERVREVLTPVQEAKLVAAGLLR